MQKHFKFTRLFYVFAMLIVITSTTANAALISFTASLDGTQSGTGSVGSGEATMWLDDTTNDFSWDVSWTNLVDVTVAHFHGPAAPGDSAGVQITIDTSSNPSSGNSVLDATQATDLLNGLWYINIHTSQFPGGEIRGQVLVSQVPSPSVLLLMLLPLIGLLVAKQNRKK